MSIINEILCGDVLEKLRGLPDQSVNCCVTSPPYWGLRDYGVAGQIGLERTPEEYVAKLVAVFREVRRVLRDDGTLWLNLGDSYASNGVSGQTDEKTGWKHGPLENEKRSRARGAGQDGLKPKDLVGIPWRVAFALQADGWYLRSDIIWAKPNPMPESVTDRPTKAHEYVFLLSKRGKYYYDAEAIKEKSVTDKDSKASMMFGSPKGKNNTVEKAHAADLGYKWEYEATRNKRSVWNIATMPYAEAHFATFPEKLVEPMILAGCPQQVCPKCGDTRRRIIENYYDKTDRKPAPNKGHLGNFGERSANMTRDGFIPNRVKKSKDKGYFDCGCIAGFVPGIVLDPFFGSGTTGLVAKKNGRNYIGIELNPEYVKLAEKRIGGWKHQQSLINEAAG